MRTALGLLLLTASTASAVMTIPIKSGPSITEKLFQPKTMSDEPPMSGLRGSEPSKALHVNGTLAGGALNFQGQVVIRNYANLQYFGEINVGADGQKFTVIFDTGSSDTWLPSGRCGRSCTNKPRYHPSKSYAGDGSYFREAYGSGTVSGYWSKDDMTIAGIKVTGQPFAEITDASGLAGIYEQGGFDGLVGMAFDSISVKNNLTPVQNMKAQGTIDWSVFSFYLGRNNADGEMMIGGVNPSRFVGELFWVPLVQASFWVVPLQGIQAGSRFIQGAKNAIVDSGTSLLIGPEAEVDALAKAIGARWSWAYGLYLIDNCARATVPDVTFNIGGKGFTLSKEDLIMVDDGTGLCALGVSPQQANLWILGDVFMRKYYCAFDYGAKRIGFAPAK